MSHATAATPSVFADAPSEAHGLMEEKPSPEPRIRRMSASAAPTKAAAATAPHETPEAADAMSGDVRSPSAEFGVSMGRSSNELSQGHEQGWGRGRLAPRPIAQ